MTRFSVAFALTLANFGLYACQVEPNRAAKSETQTLQVDPPAASRGSTEETRLTQPAPLGSPSALGSILSPRRDLRLLLIPEPHPVEAEAVRKGVGIWCGENTCDAALLVNASVGNQIFSAQYQGGLVELFISNGGEGSLQWLDEHLLQSKAHWKIVVSQMGMAALPEGDALLWENDIRRVAQKSGAVVLSGAGKDARFWESTGAQKNIENVWKEGFPYIVFAPTNSQVLMVERTGQARLESGLVLRK